MHGRNRHFMEASIVRCLLKERMVCPFVESQPAVNASVEHPSSESRYRANWNDFQRQPGFVEQVYGQGYFESFFGFGSKRPWFAAL